jgi:hypothetical protein
MRRPRPAEPNAAFCRRQRTGSGGRFKRRIVRVALCAATVEGGVIRGVERRVVLEALHQVRVGDEELAEGNAVGVAALNGLGGAVAIIAVVDDPAALAASLAIDILQLVVIEGLVALAVVAVAAGCAFDDVDEGEAAGTT